MAHRMGRSKGKEPSDSPIHTNNRQNRPMRDNHELEYLTPNTYSGITSPRKNETGYLETFTSPSWYQEVSSGRDRMHPRDRTRQVAQEQFQQSPIRRSKDTDSPLVPPKFDPQELDNMDSSYSLRDSDFDHVEGLLDSMTFREHERDTMWPCPPTEEATAENYPKGLSRPAERIENRSTGNVPQSKSEGHIKSCLKQSRDDDPYASPPYGYQYETPKRFQHHPVERESSPVRGRGREPKGKPSPVRFSEDIDEHDPLPFLRSPVRRARSPHKKLFGENGWLGRSTSMKELPAEKYRKAGFQRFSEKIKQRVGDFTGDIKKVNVNIFNSDSNNSKITSQSTFPISLDPPSQAKLLSEIEVMICVTANKFLLQQYEEGRMSVESVAKVTNFWASKNRPQVLEFQFDQSTQRDLILYNLKTFEFYGEAATNVMVLHGTLYNWKAVAKEMSIRTFCTPDSVIRKHMHDTHKILEMLGAPIITFLAFQELQVSTLARIKEEQRKRLQRSKDHGVTKEYIPRSLIEAEKAEAAAEARNTY